MSKKPGNKTKPNRGIINFIIVWFFFIGVGYLLRDDTGTPLARFGSLMWGTAMLASFLLGMLYFAQFIMPMERRESWDEGVHLLWVHYLRQTINYVNNLLSPRPRGRVRTAVIPTTLQDIPNSFARLKAGILHSHQTLAVTKANKFQRAAGPGFVVLERRELIQQVIDLRPHFRRQPVTATTKDGISVETAVFITFQVRQSPETTLDPSIPYPYDQQAIFHVSHAANIDAEYQEHNWSDRIITQAAALLIEELNRYSLDELYQADNGGVTVISEIKQHIWQQLTRRMEQDGITVHTVGISHLKIPESVAAQRIRRWQAGWQQKIQKKQVISDAQAVRRIKKARARAQIKIIETIAQNIDAMRQSEDADLTEIIMLRMIEALEEAVADSSVQAIMPQQLISNLVMDTSAQMQSLMAQQPGSNQNDA